MKLYLYSVLFVLFSNVLFAQQKRILDWQDFKKSIESSYIADPVDYGGFAIFEIRNINRFLYKVEIEGKKVSLQTPIPTELQSLFRLDKKQVDNLQGTESIKVEEAKGDLNTGKELMEGLVDKIESSSSGKLDKNDLGATKTEKENKLYELKAKNIKSNSDSTKIKDLERELIVIKNNLNKIKLKEDVESVLTECTKYIQKAEEVSKNLRLLKIARLQLIVLSQEDIGFDEMRGKVGKINFPEAIIVEKIYTEFLKSYEELEKLYEKAKAKTKILANDSGIDKEEAKEIVEEALEEIENGHEIIAEEDLLSLVSDVLQLSEGLKNEKNFRITSPPVQMDDDVAEYEVSIIPTETRTLGVHQSSVNFRFDIPTKGGLKVDFSVGPVLSFGNGSKDEKYYFVPTATADKATLQKLTNQNAISPSLAALMHFYGRSGRKRSFGGLFGIGVGYSNSIETPKAQIDANVILGVSAVLGKKEKLMLNTGISWLRVERLKIDQYKVGEIYTPSITEIKDVTEKTFRPSLFISISYNLTNRVSRN